MVELSEQSCNAVFRGFSLGFIIYSLQKSLHLRPLAKLFRQHGNLAGGGDQAGLPQRAQASLTAA